MICDGDPMFRVRYLHEKHVPLLSKKQWKFFDWLFYTTWLLPYKYTLCKFLLHLKNICVRNTRSVIVSHRR